MRVIRHPNKDIEEIGEAEVIGEGWVDLKSKPKLGKGSGMITNFQLLTKGVKHCNLHSEIDE